MKKTLLAIGSLLLASSALHAEVKPAGTVLHTYCGALNRSVSICVANSEKNAYLVLTGFAYHRDVLKGDYFLASVVNNSEGIFGASDKTYTATVLSKENNYVTEKTYQLQVSYPVVANPKITGVLMIDGENFGREIQMEAIMHTESL
jgi:hypothetical protein